MSSLVVNTNLSAIDAYNNLNSTDNAMNQAISELSSGLQIQTAADNPAGYVVSQALESQSNGYTQAISNAQNGVSLIQTASGALNQISSILQTMDQLALNSANGATNDSNSFSANQQEFLALQNQIQQIAQTTSFGSTDLLNGTFSNQVLQVGAFDNADQQVSLNIGSADINTLGVATAAQAAQVVGTGAATTGVPSGSTTVGVTLSITVDGSATTVALTLSSTTTASSLAASINADLGSTISGLVSVSTNSAGDLVFTTTSAGASQSIQIGGTNLADIGLTTTSATGQNVTSVDSQTNAQAAISSVQSAINTVASMEANVGAIQNQLQAVVANLTVGQQNLTSAYSGLVDVNFAQETTTFSTDQILMQSGVAMLSQAQQTPSLVLKLLS